MGYGRRPRTCAAVLLTILYKGVSRDLGTPDRGSKEAAEWVPWGIEGESAERRVH